MSITHQELVDAANAVSTPEDRRKSIEGTLKNAAYAGRWSARFLLEDFPISDFYGLDHMFDRKMTKKYMILRWRDTPKSDLPTPSLLT